MWIAITRGVSPNLGNCELSFLERSEIDVALAQAQHQAYEQTLVALGCHLVALPAAAEWPDSVFVEDVALVLDEVAVLTRPGAASRRGEVASVAAVLAPYRRLLEIEAPGTLDGGDILRVGRMIYVGLSGRSNRAGIEQLNALLREEGYRVLALPLLGCLHLKSAVTQVAEDTLLLQPSFIDPMFFSEYRILEVAAGEEHAANALQVGSSLVYPANFPRTADLLAQEGFDLHTVDVSELQKAEGAVTCCSLLFREA